MLVRPPDIPSSEITDESLYWSRREFLQAAGIGMAAVGGFIPLANTLGPGDWRRTTVRDDKLTPYEYITGHNNY
jgi:hypothetical protein